ncbi:MAG: excinuclease ABC subunit UvrA, partial [Candidatus Eisenbacteria bacterium]|nr:excinuclease ABC subunit UvrA [Candidatus Eisenbacteria bacterium]
ITGVSGSGKSSLAFDVLYAEGQRRFVDCLSTYARQFLQRLDRPDVDRIGEIQPPVALHQHTSIRNARSTVGSITELSDLLQLLFAHGGQPHCPACDTAMVETTLESAARTLTELPEGRYVLTAALQPPAAFSESGIDLLRAGYTRIYADGEVREWTPAYGSSASGGAKKKTEKRSAESPVHLALDRFGPRPIAGVRAREAIEAAWRVNPAGAVLYRLGETSPCRELRPDTTCPRCARVWTPLRPRHFSADSPLGACPSCHGFGRQVIVDRDKVVPDPRKTLREGAVTPFNTKTGAGARRRMLEQAKVDDVPLDRPYRDLSAEQRDWVFLGNGRYRGVEGLFQKLERKRYRAYVRIFLARYRGYTPCLACRGSRLRPEALAVRVGPLDLAGVLDTPVRDLARQLADLTLPSEREARVRAVLAEIRTRLQTLEEVGLGYLTLARTGRTLSGGETQRIRLASGLGSALTRTLYILDEPTVGLHATDSARMLAILRRLADAGNTVVVVEHDPEIIRGTDHLLVLGPSGGENGGEVLYEGPTARFFQNDPSFFRVEIPPVSARVNPAAGADAPPAPADAPERALVLEGIRHHNLDIPHLVIPTDRLVVVTGVSGSGKSTLVDDVLYRNALRHAGSAVEDVGAVSRIQGLDRFSQVLLVSQNPLGRSSRSNILTYTGLLGIVRKLLVQTPKAKSLRLKPGAFSFNVEGGRCEACKGMGTVTLEMHFMADVEVACEACRGRRFREDVLEVTYRGRCILQMLDLTVTEARKLFEDRADVHRLLEPLERIGLGYLRLGQSTSTLSGGEAQRLKIASLLADRSSWSQPGLFLLDEPTTGLHPRDIGRLLAGLRDLIARGHGVVVVEHQLDFIRAADYVVDLGPGGGDQGGRLVFTGSVAELSARSAAGDARNEAGAPGDDFGTEGPTAWALRDTRRVTTPWPGPWPSV